MGIQALCLGSAMLLRPPPLVGMMRPVLRNAVPTRMVSFPMSGGGAR